MNATQTLCALSKEGIKLWEKKLSHGLGMYPFNIKKDGTMYACLTNKLFALAPDGEIRWEYIPKKGCVSTSPSIDKEGNLYLSLNFTRLAAISSEGKEMWQTQINGTANVPPIIGNNQLICHQSYLQNEPDYVSWIEVFTSKGQKLWEQKINGTIVSTVLAKDNLLYTISNFNSFIERGKKLKTNSKWELHSIGH